MSKSNLNNKVGVKTGKSSMGTKVTQPITGNLKGMTVMGKGSTTGQGVKTVKSNPIAGSKSAQPKNTAMGTGSVIDPFI